MASIALVVLIAGWSNMLNADRPLSKIPPEVHQKAQQAIERGLGFLKATQRDDGSWPHGDSGDPAITALAVKCFLQHSAYGANHEISKKGLKFVLGFEQPDGGIYPQGYGMRNYYTSVCLMALSATGGSEYTSQIESAQAFLKKLQWDEGESIDRDNPWYGGAGYGKHKRPDLSNTQMMLEALHQSGLNPEDPTYQKAVQFIQRCQMHESFNDQSFAKGAEDGGFIYTAVNGGESKAGTVEADDQSRLRCYGSMTYAGFKSYLYARLDHNDPRVRAAYDWIRKHYTLKHNPNMPAANSKEGLYYYFHVFARAFHAWGEDTIEDVSGQSHHWREDLILELSNLQNPDGSWVNGEDRWYEGNPHLVTAYSILALQTALED